MNIATPTVVLSHKTSERVRIIYSDGRAWTFSSYYDWRQYLDSTYKGNMPDISEWDLRRIA
jgi:hypothetical protein